MTSRIQAAPDAVLGRSDETRRWAIVDPSGRPRFAGVTRTEARMALESLPEGSWEECLIAVALPVVLTDGAGPHLVDAAGRLVLAIGDHPHLPIMKLALGPVADREQAGLVVRLGDGGSWRWRARAEIATPHRVAALDALERIERIAQIADWLRSAESWV